MCSESGILLLFVMALISLTSDFLILSKYFNLILKIFFVAFENIFYGILFDLEIAGKIIKLYQGQQLPSKFHHAMTKYPRE